MDKLIELIDNTRKTAFGRADMRIFSDYDIHQKIKHLNTSQKPKSNIHNSY